LIGLYNNVVGYTVSSLIFDRTLNMGLSESSYRFVWRWVGLLGHFRQSVWVWSGEYSL